MNNIKRLGYSAMSVPNVERAVRFYSKIMGLEEIARNREAVYLRCNEHHHALALFEGEPRSLHHLGLEVDDHDALAVVREHLALQGVPIEARSWEPLGVGDGFCLRDPNGHLIEIYSRMEKIERSLPPAEVRPVRFGHLTLMTPRLDESVDFYRDVLGFRISDRVQGRLATWMRCNQEHHGVAFLSAPLNTVNHYAFDLADWNALKVFADNMSRQGVTAIYGPGRHGPGNNLFLYIPDPAGNIIELTSEVQQIWDEEGYQPGDWPNEPLSVDVWRAIMPPHHFMRGEGYAFNDWRMGSRVLGQGWSVVEVNDFKALDLHAEVTAPTEKLPEFKVHIPSFSLARKDPLDHAKFMALSDRQFAAGEGLSVSVEMAVDVHGTDDNPYGAEPDDPRLGSAAILLLDDTSGILFNFEIGNRRIMALRERFDATAPGGKRESVAFADPHLIDLNIEPGSWHRYEIRYHPGSDGLLDPGPDRIEWLVDGRKVRDIEWTVALDPTLAPVIKPSRFRIGMGIFTLLDNLPDGRGGIIPGLDPEYRKTVWGQGVTARWRKVQWGSNFL